MFRFGCDKRVVFLLQISKPKAIHTHILVLPCVLPFSEVRDWQDTFELECGLNCQSLWKVSFLCVFGSDTVKKLASQVKSLYTSKPVFYQAKPKRCYPILFPFWLHLRKTNFFTYPKPTKPITPTFCKLWDFILETFELDGGLKAESLWKVCGIVFVRVSHTNIFPNKIHHFKAIHTKP